MSEYSNPFLGANNPYLQSTIDAAQGDLTRSWNTVAQPAYNSAMVKSGSFGNEGVQQMNQESQKSLQDSLGRVSNEARAADFTRQQQMYQWDQGFNRDLYNDSYSQNNQNLQTGIGLLGTLMSYNQNDLNNGNTIQGTPLNYYQQFSNIANGIGNGYGSSNSTQGTTSNPWLTAAGGAQLGSSLYNRYSGGGSGGLSSYDFGFNGQSNPSNQAGLDSMMNSFGSVVV